MSGNQEPPQRVQQPRRPQRHVELQSVQRRHATYAVLCQRPEAGHQGARRETLGNAKGASQCIRRTPRYPRHRETPDTEGIGQCGNAPGPVEQPAQWIMVRVAHAGAVDRNEAHPGAPRSSVGELTLEARARVTVKVNDGSARGEPVLGPGQASAAR